MDLWLKIEIEITMPKYKDTQQIRTLKRSIQVLKEELFNLENQLYQQNTDPTQSTQWMKEDKAFLKNAQMYQQIFKALSSNFFGYPGNLSTDSPLVSKLRQLEAEMFYINNVGDPYEHGASALDGKVYERAVLSLFYERFELDENESWGYVTSGGSESNTWGILNGLRKFPQGHLYFCQAVHYSVLKAVTNGSVDLFPYTVIEQYSSSDERINKERLLERIVHQWETQRQAPILLLTWGTTKLGSIDEITEITHQLFNFKIPFYLHVDAAYFGGIPNNQIDAPVCPSLKVLGANSISVSLHKFFGVPNINSVVLSKDKGDGNFISYLGHRDTTISGSRTFAIFSALQRIKEVLQRSPKDYYCRNIRIFEQALIKHHLIYFKAPLSSIFVIPLPSNLFQSKYHLASFEGASGKLSLAHIIVNPFHSKQELEILINDLIIEQKEKVLKIDF